MLMRCKQTNLPFLLGMVLAEQIFMTDYTYILSTILGMAVMTQYGSPVLNWFNKALDEMKASGDFESLCKKASKQHGQYHTYEIALTTHCGNIQQTQYMERNHMVSTHACDLVHGIKVASEWL